MTARIALFAILIASVVGLVLLLNGVGAGVGVAVAALGLIAVSGGATLGYFSDRLPEWPRERRAHPLIPHQVD
jgi:hypothetical protein